MPVVMGTAGHIDHGKTTLVKHLTGVDCDRLGEEKRRGITIELGFASLDLGGGRSLSIVDVPGHERFVKNMVAGASGIDFVMLVIAADEGVMPQTREHLEICNLLGIRHGLVALTKTDMVDADWLNLVQDDVRAALSETFLAEAPMFPVSAMTGEGVPELKAALARLEKTLAPEHRSDLFRLPVDRIFSLAGHGTVVTGTMIAGSVSLGDDVMLYPSGVRSKARGLQSHGGAVEKAFAGRRTAVNLPGVEVAEITRGDVLAMPDSLFLSTRWNVYLQCLSSSPIPLKNRTEVHFHHGSREMQARLYFPDKDKLMPSEQALCEVRFEEPVAGVWGDRCVVRAFSPLRTVAGGVLVHPLAEAMHHKDPRYDEKMALLHELSDAEPARRVAIHLSLAGTAGRSAAELRVLSNMDSKALDKSLAALGSAGQAFIFDRDERRYVDANAVEIASASCLAALEAYHKREPLKAGMVRGELVSGWGRNLPAKLVYFIVERLVRNKAIVAEQDSVRLPSHAVSLAADEVSFRAALVSAFKDAGITPPLLKDVLEANNVSAKDAAPMLKLLQEEGVLVRVKDDMYYEKSALNIIHGKLKEWFAAHEDMVPNDFRDLTGLSRKFTIPLLEYFDKERITMRVGDKRVARKL